MREQRSFCDLCYVKLKKTEVHKYQYNEFPNFTLRFESRNYKESEDFDCCKTCWNKMKRLVKKEKL